MRTIAVRTYFRYVALFIFCCTFLTPKTANARRNDTLDVAWRIKDNTLRQNEIVRLFYNMYLLSSKHDAMLGKLADSLQKHQPINAESLLLFAKTLIYRRKHHLVKAKDTLLKSIAVYKKPCRSRLLYNLYLNMGFIATDSGNLPEAIRYYLLTQTEAERLNKNDLRAHTFISIADSYFHLQLYNQSLRYLEKAKALSQSNSLSDRKSINYIDINKAEIFFMLKNVDSLAFYRRKIIREAKDIHDLSSTKKRIFYYHLMLTKQFERAIPVIRSLITSENKYHHQMEYINLAECYYHLGKPDSTMSIAERLIKDPRLIYPSFKLMVYQVMAKVSEESGRIGKSLVYHKLALTEAERYNKDLVLMGDVSLQMRLKQMRDSYEAKVLIYKKERIILLFILVTALLTSITTVVLYYGIKQRRRYEKLLTQIKKRELALVNSHSVRKHLANILGLSSIVVNMKTNDEDLSKFLNHLDTSAKNLDKCIKNLDKKLREN